MSFYPKAQGPIRKCKEQLAKAKLLKAAEETTQAMVMLEDNDVYINMDTFLNMVQESNIDEPKEVPLKRRPKRRLHEEPALTHPSVASQEEQEKGKSTKRKEKVGENSQPAT